MPIVTVEAIVNWRGSSGKVAVGNRDREPDEGDEHRLGHEELRDALDVAQDLAPLGHDPRHDGEVVAHEHEIRHRARHLRARALRDREPRLLERGDVVDAVADHRHVAPGFLQRIDDGALALGRDPADRGRGQDRLPQRRRFGRQRLAVERRRRSREHPRRARSLPPWPAHHRRAPSGRRSRSPKKATVSAAFGRRRSASTTRPSALHVLGERRLRIVDRQRRVERAEREDATARARLGTRPLGERRSRGREALRRAQHQPLVAEVEGAPAAARGERHLPGDGTRLDLREPRIRDRLQRRGCGTGRWRRSRPARAPASASSTPSAGTSPRPAAWARSGCPVLSVQTTSTDASDSTAFSCWASTPRCATLNADTAAVRLIRRIRPSGTRLTIPAVSTCTRSAAGPDAGERRDGEPDRERDREREQPEQEPVVRPLERRARVPERTGGRGQLLRAAVGRRPPSPRRRAAPSTTNEPDHTGSPGAADDGLRLAGQVGLVEREALRRDHRPVGDDLVAGRQPQQIAHHHAWSTGTRRSPRPARPPPRARPAPPAGRARASTGSPGTTRSRCSTTRIPRKSASFHDPNAIVRTPNTNRIPFGIVSVLARTMLA